MTGGSSKADSPRTLVLPSALAIVLVMLVAMLRAESAPPAPAAEQSLDALRAEHRRPISLPVPADNALTAAKVDLGRRLFSDKALSRDGTVACSTCHDPALAFAGGVALNRGVGLKDLRRHSPALWNLAWAPALMWDGRAQSLEEQAVLPIEHPDEMGLPLASVAGKLKQNTAYSAAFAAAFPEQPEITNANVLKALASFERTLVSPTTRFDAWIAGDGNALTAEEVSGFQLFTGKAQCSNCHSGWAFTDHSFHDIGLPSDDLGRGPIIGLSRAEYAFKTPSLRELAWTAPYMHDGSLATLEDVVRFYEGGGVPRPTRSPELKASLVLTDEERNAIIAFLETLSSTRPPRPMAIEGLKPATDTRAETVVATSQVTQRSKLFTPAAVSLAKGETLVVLNDDTRPHNVRIADPRMMFNSGLQEPGDAARLTLSTAGTFEAFCGIHPTMRLRIEVR